jgi:hypothetical protein
MTSDFLLTEKMISGLKGVPSPSTLRYYRTQKHNDGKVPPHMKVNGRVFYRSSDLQQWLDEQIKK